MLTAQAYRPVALWRGGAARGVTDVGRPVYPRIVIEDAPKSSAAEATGTTAASDPEAARARMRVFIQVLGNTMVANVTTSFLWFALTFWVYLETENVMATGIVGGAYMLFIAIFSMIFGTLVDRYRKRQIFVFSSVVTALAFLAAWGIYLLQPESAILDFGGPWFWLFCGVILLGAVVEQMRNIALSTTVTLLVPTERHANANGMVGTVQGLAFIVTSVFSGFSIGYLGMSGTLVIAVAFTLLSFVHILFIRIPEETPTRPEGKQPFVDFRGSAAAIRAVPGLFVLLIFAMFNNLIGGVYMALMDPYGLELMSVQLWGVVFGIAATGFIVGGIVIASRGLGRNPMRTMILVVIAMGVVGSLFTIREWLLLYAVGIWLYMALVPIVEAAEQTVIQKVVPYEKQGRVFGLASTMEASAAPITAFLIAPIAQYAIIPHLNSVEGQNSWRWLLGDGEARGIAVIFLFAGIATILLGLFAFTTKAYRRLSALYAGGADGASDERADERADDVTVPSVSAKAGGAGDASGAVDAREPNGVASTTGSDADRG